MKPTFQLISIFVLALLLFVGYSKAPDYVADALHLKQIGQDITTADADTMHVEDAASDTITEPVDTARQRVLIFGDSMSQLLALRLCDYTNANGHSLTCVTWNGSGTHQWAASDTLRFYMQRVRPTHVFVCLGSNELYSADMKGCRKRAERILAKIGNVPTTWIGPPNWMEDKGINNMLQGFMGKRRFFMTKGMKLDRQEDGRHPTYAAAAKWMDSIVEWMNSGKAAHPFVMNKPTTHSRRYTQIIIPMNPGKAATTDSIDVNTTEEPLPKPISEQEGEQKKELKSEQKVEQKDEPHTEPHHTAADKNKECTSNNKE